MEKNKKIDMETLLDYAAFMEKEIPVGKGDDTELSLEELDQVFAAKGNVDYKDFLEKMKKADHKE